MTHLLNTAVAALVLIGTGLQAYVSLRQVKENDPDGHRAFVTVDDLKAEFTPARHPVRWMQRRREVSLLLRESPEEARLYKRVWLQMASWLLLTVAAAFAVLISLLSE